VPKWVGRGSKFLSIVGAALTVYDALIGVDKLHSPWDSATAVRELDSALAPELFRRDPLPWPAGFLAGKCFRAYRRREGAKRSPLPDFFIGAHAAINQLTLLTRNAARYRTYFPRLEILAP
jgi:predicted nucleic acid-binding protein